MKKELCVSSVMIVLTLGSFGVMHQIEDPNAITFPQVVLWIMLILGGLLAVQTLMTAMKGAAKSKNAARAYPFGAFFTALAAILIYFAIMENVGFYVSGFLFFLIITLVLQEEKQTVRNVLTRAGAAAAFMGVLFVLFNKILAVQTPKGVLF